MIKQLTGVELSSSKARSGLTSVSELLPRLIRSYELQAELMQRRYEQAAESKPKHCPAPIPPSDSSLSGSSLSDLSLGDLSLGEMPLTQTTFTWF